MNSGMGVELLHRFCQPVARGRILTMRGAGLGYEHGAESLLGIGYGVLGFLELLSALG